MAEFELKQQYEKESWTKVIASMFGQVTPMVKVRVRAD